MKSTRLVLTALFAAACAVAPLAARAHDGGQKGKQPQSDGGPGGTDPGPGDNGAPGGDRDGDHDGGGDQRGQRMGPRDGPGAGHGVPFWMKDGPDAEMRAKLDKVRVLEGKIRDIGGKLTRGTDAEKAASKIEARKAVSELFDAKLDLDTAMVAKMEKNIAEMKEKLAKRKANRDRVIDSRVSRMTGEGDDWD